MVKSSISKSLGNGMVELLAFDIVPGQSSDAIENFVICEGVKYVLSLGLSTVLLSDRYVFKAVIHCINKEIEYNGKTINKLNHKLINKKYL